MLLDAFCKRDLWKMLVFRCACMLPSDKRSVWASPMRRAYYFRRRDGGGGPFPASSGGDRFLSKIEIWKVSTNVLIFP